MLKIIDSRFLGVKIYLALFLSSAASFISPGGEGERMNERKWGKVSTIMENHRGGVSVCCRERERERLHLHMNFIMFDCRKCQPTIANLGWYYGFQQLTHLLDTSSLCTMMVKKWALGCVNSPPRPKTARRPDHAT